MPNLLVICQVTDAMEARLASEFTLYHLAKLEDPLAWLRGQGSEIEYVLTDGQLGVAREMMDLMPNLKAISNYGVGYDAIDTDLCRARNLPVSHTPNVLNDDVAITAIFLYLACFRNFIAEVAHARDGGWEAKGNLPLPRAAHGRKIGILGLGRIGKNLAKKLEAFDCEISYFGRRKQDVPYRYFDDLIAMAEAVEALICVAPGGEETHHLVNDAVIRALGREGVLVNVGRGSVVDEAALIKALETERIAAVGLDVFEREPHIPEALRRHSRAILTPHIGSASVETRRDMGDLAIDNLFEFKRHSRLLTPVPECLDM